MTSTNVAVELSQDQAELQLHVYFVRFAEVKIHGHNMSERVLSLTFNAFVAILLTHGLFIFILSTFSDDSYRTRNIDHNNNNNKKKKKPRRF